MYLYSALYGTFSHEYLNWLFDSPVGQTNVIPIFTYRTEKPKMLLEASHHVHLKSREE